MVTLTFVFANEEELKKMCSGPRSNFVETGIGSTPKELKGYTLMSAFSDNKKRVLGKGAFGEVKEAAYPGQSQDIAIKRIGLNSKNRGELKNIAQELSINLELSKKVPGVGPTYYGCQYTLDQQNQIDSVYIASQKLFRTFEQDIPVLQTMPKDRYLYLHIQIIEKLQKLWDIGYRHSDIKPGNIMINEDRTEAFLVDFGLAQKNKGMNYPQGTPGYMNPGAYEKRGRAEQRDDIYSWLMTFIAVLMPKGEWTIWELVNEKDCIDSQPDKFCLEQLREGLFKLMVGYGWAGEWEFGFSDYEVDIGGVIKRLVKIDHEQVDYYYEDIRDILINNQKYLKNGKIVGFATEERVDYSNNYDANDLAWLKQRAAKKDDFGIALAAGLREEGLIK